MLSLTAALRLPETLRRSRMLLERYGIVLLLILFLFLGGLYSVVTPILEALDEVWHVAVIHHIIHERALPVQPADPAATGLWRQQGSQPPLYYLIGSLLVAAIDTNDFPDLVQYNPHASGGHPDTEGNKNILLHWPSAERFPYRGTALAVHILRLYSLVLGALTIYGIYRLARQWWPPSSLRPLAAAAMVAFNPQFVYIHSGVINDVLAITLCTWVLERASWLLGVDEPFAARRRWTWLAIGVGSGLAILSKLSSALLLPLIALLLLWLGWRQRAYVTAALHLLAITGSAAFTSGWWFWRNWQLYGDPTGLNRFIAVAGTRVGSFGVTDYLRELPGLHHSYWAVFGWFSIRGDPILYPLFLILDGVALAGVLVWAVRMWRRRSAVSVSVQRSAFLAAWFLLFIVALYFWTKPVMGTQGRLIFPAASSMAIGLVGGWSVWLPKKWRPWGLGGLVALLAAIALVAPFRYIAPAYRLPARLAPEQATDIPQQVHLRYGDWGELAGYALETPIVEPGEPLSITFYWQSLAPVTEAYDLYVHLRDADGHILGQLDTYPGWGMYPTFLWDPPEIIVDRYRIPLQATSAAPLVGRIEVGFCCNTAGQPFTAYDPEGRAVTPVIGHFKIRGTQEPVTVPDESPRFGEWIVLVDWAVDGERGDKRIAHSGESLRLNLTWVALRQPPANYSVFVHLVDNSASPLAQADGEPQQGQYPTRFWERGERIAEERALALPDTLPLDDYHILIGLYDLGSGARIPLQDAAGAVLGDAYRLPITIQLR